MGQSRKVQRAGPRPGGWLRLAILALLAEKVVQHVAVTIGFATDAGGIRATVALPYQVFLVAGAALTLLFALAAWRLWRREDWARALIIALAVADILGEFAAQGSLILRVTVSLVVASVLLILALLYREGSRTPVAQ